MKRLIYLAAAVLIVIGLGISYFSPKTFTFKEAVLDKLDTNRVASIEIIKRDQQGEHTKNVTNSEEINEILNSLSAAKLKKSRASDIEFTETYWMTLKTKDKGRAYGMTLYDNEYINTFEYNAAVPKNASRSYKITNDFNAAAIRNVFK
jgi:LPS O-antigen subunit length determinant protein (WzzB/FepE family)